MHGLSKVVEPVSACLLQTLGRCVLQEQHQQRQKQVTRASWVEPASCLACNGQTH